MIDRMQLGRVPEKPHIVFEPDGGLAYEECFTRQGFEGAYSVLYHRHPPTRTTDWKLSSRGWKLPTKAPAEVLARRHFVSPRLSAGGHEQTDADSHANSDTPKLSAARGRSPLLFHFRHPSLC